MRVDVKRGIPQSLGGVSQRLELGVVSGSHSHGLLREEMEENGTGKGRALTGVRIRPQFVQKDKALPGGAVDDANDVAHVPAECGQGLLYALLITDVGEYAIEDRNAALRPGGHRQACLRHQAQEPYSLEGNRLPTGIWSGDDQGRETASQFDRERDGLLPQQGVPGLQQPEHAGCSIISIAAFSAGGDHYGLGGTGLSGISCLGQGEVYLCNDIYVARYLLIIPSNLRAKRRQNSFHLMLLFHHQFTQFIAHIQRSPRLDEQRGPRIGDIMDDAFDLPPVLDLDRNHEASLPFSDYRFLYYLLSPG